MEPTEPNPELNQTLWSKLPRELVQDILVKEGSLFRMRNGRIMKQIPKNDPRYSMVESIPKFTYYDDGALMPPNTRVYCAADGVPESTLRGQHLIVVFPRDVLVEKTGRIMAKFILFKRIEVEYTGLWELRRFYVKKPHFYPDIQLSYTKTTTLGGYCHLLRTVILV